MLHITLVSSILLNTFFLINGGQRNGSRPSAFGAASRRTNLADHRHDRQTGAIQIELANGHKNVSANLNFGVTPVDSYHDLHETSSAHPLDDEDEDQDEDVIHENVH